jgi:hypothetical protein
LHDFVKEERERKRELFITTLHRTKKVMEKDTITHDKIGSESINEQERAINERRR